MNARGWLAGALVALAACGEPMEVATPNDPVIESAAVAAGPHNVLSAVVHTRVRDADSVAVRYEPMAAAAAMTLAVIPTDGSVAIPVLGLLPAAQHAFQVVAWRAGRALAGEVLWLTTGALPADLPRLTAGGPDPSPGYVVFAAGAYGVVIDNSGRVVWYRRFPDGVGLNFQAQPPGRYVARPPTPANGPWIELDPLGDVLRTFGCARGLVARFHDLIAEPDGSYWVMCDETRTMNLTASGGVANAQVTGTVVQHVGMDGTLLFEWNPFDHLAISDLDADSRSGNTVNWTHGNALDLDTDGNLLISFRSLSEITKVDVRTGAVLWRLGGLRNQFTWEGAPGPGFARQHGLRSTGPGKFVLLDNLGDPAGSRAERYTYDMGARTARLMSSYGPDPPVTALLGGTTQNLPGGRTLVSFGNGGRVQEYDAAGAVTWEIVGNAGYVFRAQRIQSLYRPGADSPR